MPFEPTYIDRAVPVEERWWIDPPPGFRPFYETGMIDCPTSDGITPSAETTVLEFLIPQGYGGVVKAVKCLFEGTGYLNGSGSLVWRFYQGPVQFTSLGDVQEILGAQGFCEPLDGGLIFGPNGYLRITVTNMSLVTSGARIIASFKGYYVPSEIVRDWQTG